jgi:hypothetical protein
MRRLSLALSFVLVSGLLAGAGEPAKVDDPRIKKAREVFDLYVSLEHSFDPKAADLYSDSAVIRNKRTYPTGQIREMTLPASQYKDLIRQSMPLAKSRGDMSTYTEVTYTVEGDGVRIKATRYSELKKYSSPLSILVRPSPEGPWLIYEELSESRPI